MRTAEALSFILAMAFVCQCWYANAALPLLRYQRRLLAAAVATNEGEEKQRLWATNDGEV